ncbi:hypothetical protein HUJ04_013601 [Dendroctonus ponderosae]|uniref:Uncharacterized protein n=1 Tax=Dendroctonus ponderosae TaxID=77166 RepID=J3JV54_DENPD
MGDTTYLQLNGDFPTRLPDDINAIMSNKVQNYGIPSNYDPADHPPVRLRHNHHCDQSETQRKRRSKNRLSNRRSTGYVSPEMVEEALKMGDLSEKV